MRTDTLSHSKFEENQRAREVVKRRHGHNSPFLVQRHSSEQMPSLAVNVESGDKTLFGHWYVTWSAESE